MERFDVVIVGGGSAGCALAGRLSEDPTVRVLVLEAGRRDWRWDVRIHMPAALSMPIGNPSYDWCYVSEPEPHLGGRRVHHARGKVLGGSSSINGMIFQRGNPRDYDRWAQQTGEARWRYEGCLPYFRRMETCTAGADDWRGGDGPLVLERGPASGPLFDAFFAAVEEAGFGRTDDVNGARQEGFAAFDRNISRGRRLSAARAYVHPALHRPNLEVRCGALTHRVILDGPRAVGVEYSHRGTVERVEAGEIICCAGAFGSPEILQRSGVGPPEVLRAAGIDVRHALPGVGAGLEDHLEVYVQHACTAPITMQPALRWWRRPDIGARWLFGRTGPGATNHFEAGGFVRSRPDEPYPNLMIHFLPLAIRYDGTAPAADHGYQLHIGPMLSKAHGDVAIGSDDPTEKARLRFNYLSTDQDRREWLEAIRCARHLLGQPALQAISGGELSPGPSVESDDEILAWVARDAETALHPSCTCRMGRDPMAVTDPATLRVHGLDGLRVVDASIFPSITNANIYAPVMMVAEQAADIIRGRAPLAPAPPAPDERPTAHA